MDEVKELEAFAIIGFDGKNLNTLKCHPDGIHILFPMGNKICIQNWKNRKMNFLSGHTKSITTLNVSPNGKFVGSGEENENGCKSLVILWDFETRKVLGKHEYHMVRVESLAFSCDDLLMMTIGGQDCGQICIWNVETNSALCTHTATKITTGGALTLGRMHRNPRYFVTGGENNLRVWNVNVTSKTTSVTDVSMGKLKRKIICITINKNDDYGYCGTMSGDIIKIRFAYANNETECQSSMYGCLAKCGKWKKNTPRPETSFYSLGVCCIIIMDDETLIIGAGDGTLDHLEDMKWTKPLPRTKTYSPVSPYFRSIKLAKLKGSITSMQMLKNQNTKDQHFIAGTKTCEIYMISTKTFQITLVVTCHTSAVNEIAFPYGLSEIFATAGTGDVRVWNLKTCQELLRIQVANFICTSVLFTFNGKNIITGWNDGCIRAFTPLTGKLVYCITNAHNKGTSAIAITSDGKTLVSGGCEGQVRVWDISLEKQTLKAILKEHRCPITAIRINNINTEAVSASLDRSCIIWDIEKLCQRQVIFANTAFSSVCYEPNGCQILTVGTDRRVAYWQTSNGALLRELEASDNNVNALHINDSGNSFVTGGADQIIKLWKYDDGIYTHIGLGHSGNITTTKFSHNGNYIISASETGDIFIWKCPLEHQREASVPSSAKSKRSTPRIPTKFSPHKEENISKIDTARSSIISNGSCTCKNKSSDIHKRDILTPTIQCVSCNNKIKKSLTLANICTPPISIKD